MKTSNSVWHVQNKTIPKTSSDIIDILIKNRDINKKDVEIFLNPPTPHKFTPTQVGIHTKQMEKAVQRILLAKENNEKVVIFGDYDADGICATAILWEALYGIGVQAIPFIPHREKHGYGLSDKALDEILQNKIDLLITVDNGIVAHGPFKRLKEAGVSTILTDHHLAEETLPPADYIVHTTQLCGATVAWMLAKEINKESAMQSLDLAAIATIADQVPLLGANRAFAKHGLIALRQTKRPGLLELMRIAKVDPTSLDTYTINFAIAPRLNAMGRLKHAMDALRLVCTKTKEKAELLAQNTQDTNENRQNLTWQAMDTAKNLQNTWKEEHIIIVAGEDFHDGVIGLIAGRLMEEFWKPAIVINISGDASKASARSVPGVNIIELIRKTKHLLIEAGGHPMAAGFSIETTKIELFKETLQNIAREEISKDLLQKCTEIECILPPQLVSLETAKQLKQLEPFGMGNPKPVFGMKGLEIHDMSGVGQDGKHLRVLLKDEKTGVEIKGIGFGMGKRIEELKEKKSVDVAGYLQENTWKSRTEVQMVVRFIGD